MLESNPSGPTDEMWVYGEIIPVSFPCQYSKNSGFEHCVLLSAGPWHPCLPHWPLSPFHCEFHSSQVVPGLDSFLSDLAVNIDVGWGLTKAVSWLTPNM